MDGFYMSIAPGRKLSDTNGKKWRTLPCRTSFIPTALLISAHSSRVYSQDESPVKGEAGLITKSGQKVVVEVSAHTEFIDGKPAYIQCILRDVSERTLIEKALRESEKKYVDLYQNAPDGYHSIGPDGTILEVNDTWVRMLGYERKEVIRRMKITDIIEDRGQQIFRETFADLKKKGYRSMWNIH